MNTTLEEQLENAKAMLEVLDPSLKLMNDGFRAAAARQLLDIAEQIAARYYVPDAVTKAEPEPEPTPLVTSLFPIAPAAPVCPPEILPLPDGAVYLGSGNGTEMTYPPEWKWVADRWQRAWTGQWSGHGKREHYATQAGDACHRAQPWFDEAHVIEPSEPQVKMPEPPAGCRWEYRGKGWKSENTVIYAYATPYETYKGESSMMAGYPLGEDRHHYWEAVPIAKDPLPVIDLAMKYRTRDGREVTGLEMTDESLDYPIKGSADGTTQWWTNQGFYYWCGDPSSLDLIPTGELA